METFLLDKCGIMFPISTGIALLVLSFLILDGWSHIFSLLVNFLRQLGISLFPGIRG